MASIYENTGISVKLGRRDGDWAITLKDAVETYRHEISSEHGFDRADISFAVNRNDVSSWIDRGLGMDIDVRDRAGTQIWNGFADNVDVNEGARKTSVGRLTDIANRVIVIYAIVIEDGDEPIVGEQTVTEYANNTASQDDYGVWTRVITGGTRTVAEANQIRDVVLDKFSYPVTSYNITAAGETTISLKCSGYYKYLDAFLYNSDDNDEVLTSEKIKRVLAVEAATNGMLSTDYAMIEDPSVYVTGYEDQNRTGLTVVKECVAFGDGSNNTWTFGVYEDKRVMFNVIPTTIDYVHRRGLGPTIERLSGGNIDPWKVRPGKWLFMPDMILGGAELPIPDTREQLYRDRRVGFVERVNYTAPYGVSMSGATVSRSSQQLARWGLGSL